MRIRNAICEKILQLTKHRNVYYELEIPRLGNQSGTLAPAFVWRLPPANDKEQQQQWMHSLARQEFDKELVRQVRAIPDEGKIEFELQPQSFTEEVLLTDVAPKQRLGKSVVFEFSSPNIAKPFHVGHLRSTIIGNVLANLHTHLGYDVTKLNYLGDWGTQFGMLQVGVEMENITDEQVRQQPIQTLYQAYVAANTAAKRDPGIHDKARHCFTQLEQGTNDEMTRQWQQYRFYTIAELEQMYERLGVRFDFYEWESQYSQLQISDILTKLGNKSLLFDETDGRKVVQVDGRRVPIIKSDGSTLYLARDIAALVDRFHRFRFEHIFYVVDNAQTDHFNACFKTTAQLCSEITPEQLHHVKFGRIHGMSTRNGNVVFLREVLDEARDIMQQKQLDSPTTKVELSSHGDQKAVPDVLGVSAVIINDLKQRRQRDYNFDWSKALQVNGDTGIKLQYTHCRLYSLLEKVGDINVDDVRPDVAYLLEPEAQQLVQEIARFEQSVWLAKQQLEACVLVNYLFALCNTTSRALKRLNVKNEACIHKQRNRILLFKAAKSTLHTGMRILGLYPLNKM